MNWKNIKVGLCPKCAFTLQMRGLLEPQYHCMNLNCDFHMGDQAYKKLIESMRNKDEESEEDIHML